MNRPTDILEIGVDQDAVLMDLDAPEEYRCHLSGGCIEYGL